MKSVAILQSNYIPWKGYFDLIASVDLFVIYDTVQYTKNDWRNRNKLIINREPAWITVPVKQDTLHQKINETRVVNNAWAQKHWRTIEQNYKKCDGYSVIGGGLKELYEKFSTTEYLSDINRGLLEFCCKQLDINTKISVCPDSFQNQNKTQRLIEICQNVGADHYISGPAAKSYMDLEAFSEAGISCQWMDYSGYEPYPQRSSRFEHQVSILDLLFNTGKNCRNFMKSAKKVDG